MKNKLTIKQEGFCKTYIETGNASEAYRINYNANNMKQESIVVKASELMKNGKVAVRVSELQTIINQKFDVTLESLTREIEEDRQMARDLKQPNAAISALNLKARIHGMDKQVVSNDPENPMPTLITVEIIHK